MNKILSQCPRTVYGEVRHDPHCQVCHGGGWVDHKKPQEVSQQAMRSGYVAQQTPYYQNNHIPYQGFMPFQHMQRHPSETLATNIMLAFVVGFVIMNLVMGVFMFL